MNTKAALWTGRVLSGLAILFLTVDGAIKLVPIQAVTDSLKELGYPTSDSFARFLGVVTLVGTALYAWPRTSLLGAVLLTGLMGGAIATHLRLDHPLFSHTLFGVYLGLLLWGGLWLPVANGKAAAAVADIETGADMSKRSLKLLFVDDDFLISLSTAALLEDLGHAVIKASSGSAALDVLKSDKPVDIMITDYAMPGMTGLQLAEAARMLRPGLPILLATGYADLPGQVKLDLPRLSKPYQQRQLAEQIMSLVG